MSDNPSTATDPFAVTALDEATELRALSQALRLAQGFKLIFARCNQPEQRRNLMASLRTELPELNVQEIHFSEPIMHLLDELRLRIAEPAPDAVFVSGLEFSLPVAAEADATPLVANLNASRNSFPKAIPCPLVLWIPEYVLNAIMLGAPDFFSIRSGVYFFAAAPGDTSELAATLMAGSEWAAEGLSLAEKQERIEAIKSLLADYEALPEDQRDYQTEMRLNGRLGNLFLARSDISSAQKYFEKLLQLARDYGNRVGESIALIGLGNIYVAQGRLVEAEETYKQTAAISQAAGDPLNEAMAFGNLGNIYIRQGRLDEAEKYYQQALKIYGELDYREGEGMTLGNLGIVYAWQERLAEAEDMFGQSLEISRSLNDRAGEMFTLNNLSNLNVRQGRLSEAEQFLQQSLLLARELGDIRIEGATLNNLGSRYQQQGNLTKAEEFYNESLAIRRKGGDRLGQGSTLKNLALLWMQRGDLARAVENAQQAVQVLKTTEYANELKEAQDLLETLRQQKAEEQQPQ